MDRFGSDGGYAGNDKAKTVARAIAGEFRYVADAYGKPVLISETDLAAPLAAKRAADDARLAVERANPKPKHERVHKPRQKSPAQWEAEWARISARNALDGRFGGMFLEHHLRLTLPHKKPADPDPDPEKMKTPTRAGGLFRRRFKNDQLF